MKRSTKAALLSGLVFPGIGHMVLKRYRRGSVLMLLALAAFSVVVTQVLQRALTIVDRIESGAMPLDSGAIAEAVSRSSAGANSLVESTAMIVLVACWLIGIIDSYRLGVTRDEGAGTNS
jgi:hypothetical protein